MVKNRWALIPLLLMVGAVASHPACLLSLPAQGQVVGAVEEGSPGPFFATDGLALRGYDPVAYFIDGKPVKGSPEYEWEWGGVTWRFASADNRERFRNDPERFAPQYGGFCAWAVAHNYLYPVDPFAWKIVDDKLYLNANQRVQRNWERDIPGLIKRADANWPALRSR